MSFGPRARRNRRDTGLYRARELVRSMPLFKTGGTFDTGNQFKVPSPSERTIRRRSRNGNAQELAQSLYRDKDAQFRMGF